MDNSSLRALISSLETKSYVNKTLIEAYKQRLTKDHRITRDENSEDHFCTFFLPLDRKTGRMFLVDHIKGRDWMPPGGHLDPGETPMETVKREMREELGHSITTEPIVLFDITIKDITNPLVTCRIHYDFLHLVLMDEKVFTFDKSEFTDARWVPIEEGIKMVQTPVFKEVLSKIPEQIGNTI
jgi:8-oxo-dGTP diphosphatase